MINKQLQYHFKTTSTPLAAFIRVKYQAEIEFKTELQEVEANRPPRVVFLFESNTIDFKQIENIYLTSNFNQFFNELQNLKNIVRTLIPFSKEKI